MQYQIDGFQFVNCGDHIDKNSLNSSMLRDSRRYGLVSVSCKGGEPGNKHQLFVFDMARDLGCIG